VAQGASRLLGFSQVQKLNDVTDVMTIIIQPHFIARVCLKIGYPKIDWSIIIFPIEIALPVHH
jgi:hypothetical protein